MKKKFTLFLFSIFCIVHTNAQTVNIPDPEFLAYLLSSDKAIAKDLNGISCSIDTNKNGKIEASEAENISYLFIQNSANISSLEGIQAFKNLKELEISYTNISTVDLSKFTKLESLTCNNNKLVSLDVSNLINLNFLDVSDNLLTTLDISKNVELTRIAFSSNSIQTIYMKSVKPKKWDLFWGYNNPIIYVCCNASDKELIDEIVSESNTKPVISFDCDEEAIVNITDSKFLNYLLQSSSSNSIAKDLNGNNCAIDTNGNGKIEVSEATNIGYLNLIYDYNGSFKFDSSEGINLFINLKELIVATPGTSGVLDLSNLKKLEKIESVTSPEKISKLDISECIGLKEILITGQSLTSFNAWGYKNLEKLDLSDNNLTSISLYNIAGTMIPDSEANKLVYLNVSGNQLTDLDISKCTNLQELKCDNNKLSALVLHYSKKLTDISCTNNLITLLSVINHKDLKTLHAANNSISSLDISKNTALEYLNFTNNKLKTLYLKSGNPNKNWANLNIFEGNSDISYICSDTFDQDFLKNKATEYKINPDISSDCSEEPIVDITDPNFLFYLTKVSSNPDYFNAQDLNGNYCAIDTNGNGKIEVSEAENISVLYIDINSKFIYYDSISIEGIKGFKNLKKISFSGNKIINADLSNLSKLDMVSAFNLSKIENLNLSGCTSLEYVNMSRSNLDSINLSGAINLKELILEQNLLTSLDLSNLTNLEKLSAPYNSLTSLNLSNCNSLKFIDLGTNQLTSLDASENPNLEKLVCERNKLTTLNVTNLTNLTELGADDNELTELDLSDLTSLTHLSIAGNKINSLDLSKNVNLIGLVAWYSDIKNIILKTGKPKKDYYWDNMGFWQNPLEHICCDDFDLDTIKALVEEFSQGSYPTLETKPVISTDCGNSIEEPTKPIEPTEPVEEVETSKTSNSILARPNPAKDKISFTELVDKIEIYTFSGKQVISASINSNQMDISKLQPGTYILKIRINKKTYTQKLIKL